MKLNKQRAIAQVKTVNLRDIKLSKGDVISLKELHIVEEMRRGHSYPIDYVSAIIVENVFPIEIRIADLLNHFRTEDNEPIYKQDGDNIEFPDELEIVSSRDLLNKNGEPIYNWVHYKAYEYFIKGQLNPQELMESGLRDTNYPPRQFYTIKIK